MKGLAYHLYDVFTDQPFSGNPLAVFLDANGLDGAQMAQIANELNLSETIFVAPSGSANRFDLRIFTPRAELPFAGHPTIGAACALRDIHGISDALEFTLPAGPLVVTGEGDRMQFQAPLAARRIDSAQSRQDAARLLNLPPDQVLRLDGVDAGVPFAAIRLASRDALRDCSISTAEWGRHWAGGALPHIYAYRWADDDHHVDARMFAPLMGIDEDPATGGAAAALAAVLPDGDYTIFQGQDMGRPSQIGLKIAKMRAQISGTAVAIGRGEIFLH